MKIEENSAGGLIFWTDGMQVILSANEYDQLKKFIIERYSQRYIEFLENWKETQALKLKEIKEKLDGLVK